MPEWLRKLAKAEVAAVFDSETIALEIYVGGKNQTFAMSVKFKTMNPQDCIGDLKSMARQLGKFVADYGTVISNRFPEAKMVGDALAAEGLVTKLKGDVLIFENGMDDVMRGV
jgi:hypothetical protein